jgi:hypothetical protein
VVFSKSLNIQFCYPKVKTQYLSQSKHLSWSEELPISEFMTIHREISMGYGSFHTS